MRSYLVFILFVLFSLAVVSGERKVVRRNASGLVNAVQQGVDATKIGVLSFAGGIIHPKPFTNPQVSRQAIAKGANALGSNFGRNLPSI
jgi:hypothetical protein